MENQISRSILCTPLGTRFFDIDPNVPFPVNPYRISLIRPFNTNYLTLIMRRARCID